MEIKNIASHDGIVQKIGHGKVSVQIESTSACASCQAHSKCGFAESKNKIVEVPTSEWSQYKEGDKVNVRIDEQHGLLAVWIAYVLPAILMLAVIITLSLLHVPEPIVIAITFGIVGIYVLALYLLRHRIGKRFTLSVEPC